MQKIRVIYVPIITLLLALGFISIKYTHSHDKSVKILVGTETNHSMYAAAEGLLEHKKAVVFDKNLRSNKE